MMPDPIIRPARPADLDICARFDPTVERAMLARKIDCGEILLACNGDEPVGYARMEYLWSKLPFIGLIVVAEAHRGRGVGRALLRFIEQQAAARGHRRLFSSSMVDAVAAQQWHRRMGFVECGMVSGVNDAARDGDGPGEVFYRKTLGG